MKRYQFIKAVVTLILSSVIIFNINAVNTHKSSIVKGKIALKSMDKPASYSSIALFDKNNNLISYGTLADDNGKFYIKDVPYGKYNLVIYLKGYYKKYLFDISISKNHNKIDIGKIMLDRDSKQISDFDIVSHKPISLKTLGSIKLYKNILPENNNYN